MLTLANIVTPWKYFLAFYFIGVIQLNSKLHKIILIVMIVLIFFFIINMHVDSLHSYFCLSPCFLHFHAYTTSDWKYCFLATKCMPLYVRDIFNVWMTFSLCIHFWFASHFPSVLQIRGPVELWLFHLFSLEVRHQSYCWMNFSCPFLGLLLRFPLCLWCGAATLW